MVKVHAIVLEILAQLTTRSDVTVEWDKTLRYIYPRSTVLLLISSTVDSSPKLNVETTFEKDQL
ncbi:hypothetical protein MAR_028891 [Mya arenaria]|uniref:Uncharacterized protein n=1 Tax=Mya arenaria TaxID=6604 RepID=A0ABY7DHW7_MYAAR|nr:hypothetical protein MAR_028891 [Mya arenaria]